MNTFKELLDRSMLLFGEETKQGDAHSSRVHDIICEFALPIAKEEMLGEFYGGEGQLSCKFMKLRVLHVESSKLRKHVETSLSHVTTNGITFKYREATRSLENLQIRYHLNITDVGVVRGLCYLRRLRVLRMKWEMRELCCSEFVASINKFRELTILHIWIASALEDIDGAPPSVFDLQAFQPPPSLWFLILYMRMQRIPSALTSHSRIAVLNLKGTKLSEDPIAALQSLPNLSTLNLSKAYTCQKIGGCGRGSFPSLKNLSLGSMEKWGEIEEGSFPCLSYLHIFQN
ncbi:hypothetical protein AMTR_s00006p00265550 [Amborella trichopoda]|uniref:Disease resistance R13L4/SHOC-2-like LRR domain-containing protein n=2 Tax=Amborella trichopoda TaxID=13333 RepID=W1PFN8_AMBTC|nr:hypothetical protein AMTR_s00006p00265550 [Amborella trichopoda]